MKPVGQDTLNTRRTLTVNGRDYAYFSIPEAARTIGDVSRLPVSLKILLENVLRFEDGASYTVADAHKVAAWLTDARSTEEVPFKPARILMQDFTGVPAVVDLAAMRDGITKLDGDPQRVNPLVPVDLVIDHSVMVDFSGTPQALQQNVEVEFERNGERYAFLRWGQEAFQNFRVVPPGAGICHQVNLEYISQVVWTADVAGETLAYPDTLYGTDSHTTMVNGAGVLGWGVGGIEAEAAMLGQPIAMLIPDVIGFRLTGQMPEGATATDLVLTVTQILRKKGVVGKFVEFYGAALDNLTGRRPRHHRQHGARIRRHLRLLPGGCEDAGLSAPDRPRRGPHRAGRGLSARPGHVPRRRHARPGVHRHGGAGPFHRRAEPGRTEAPAGPRDAEGCGRRVPRRPHGEPGRGGKRCGPPRSGRGQQLRSRPWRRGDCGDHELHQYVQPLRAGGGRAGGPQGARARLASEALGEDEPGARQPGGDGISRPRRPLRGSRRAGLPDHRLWLHHLHRQFRPAG